MSAIYIDEIKEFLPHRYPFLLVDRVLVCEPGKEVVAIKNVTVNEPFFAGHFPHHPVMPGVLLLEAMAQAAAILSFRSAGAKATEHSVYYLAGIDGARFKRPVKPGDQVVLRATVEREVRGVWKYAARAEVDGQLVAEATILAAKREI